MSEAKRLRRILRAVEAQIAIALDDLGVPIEDFPPPDLHPADKIEHYLARFAYHHLAETPPAIPEDREAAHERRLGDYIARAKASYKRPADPPA